MDAILKPSLKSRETTFKANLMSRPVSACKPSLPSRPFSPCYTKQPKDSLAPGRLLVLPGAFFMPTLQYVLCCLKLKLLDSGTSALTWKALRVNLEYIPSGILMSSTSQGTSLSPPQCGKFDGKSQELCELCLSCHTLTPLGRTSAGCIHQLLRCHHGMMGAIWDALLCVPSIQFLLHVSDPVILTSLYFTNLFSNFLFILWIHFPPLLSFSSSPYPFWETLRFSKGQPCPKSRISKSRSWLLREATSAPAGEAVLQ